MKDSVDKAVNNVKKGVADVRDSVDETIHRSSAEGEKAKREAAGNTMTGSEKVTSVANEVKERGEATVDHVRRNVRDAT